MNPFVLCLCCLCLLTACAPPVGILVDPITTPIQEAAAERSPSFLRENPPTTTTPQKEDAAAPPVTRCTVTAHALTLRAAPSVESRPLDWLTYGEVLTPTLPLTANWQAVHAHGRAGYVSTRFLMCEGVSLYLCFDCEALNFEERIP